MVVVVPSLAERKKSHPPAIGRKVARLKAPRSPGMSCRVHEPSGVKSHYGANENTPHQKRKSADSEQHSTQYDYGNVVIFRNPNVELVFGQIGNVTRQRSGVMMHRLAHENPSHVRPPFAFDGRMGIAILIGKLVMNAMRGHPENRSAFEGEGGANRQEIFHPLVGFVAAMREQPVIAHANAQAARNPP